MSLQTSLVLIQSPVANQTRLPQDTDDRETFSHPALDGLANLTNVNVDKILSKERLANLGTQMGMPDIIRWEPRMVSRVVFSRGTLYGTNILYRKMIWQNPALML